MTLTAILDDELWLWRDPSGQWHLALPWIKAGGRPAPGLVDAQHGHFVRLRADTEVDVTVWHEGCAGCERLREALTSGVAADLRLEHSHGRP